MPTAKSCWQTIRIEVVHPTLQAKSTKPKTCWINQNECEGGDETQTSIHYGPVDLQNLIQSCCITPAQPTTQLYYLANTYKQKTRSLVYFEFRSLVCNFYGSERLCR